MLRSPASTVPRFWRTRLALAMTSKPATRAVPLVGSSRVHSMRMVVDLPAPLGPSRPNTSPRGTCKLTPATAVNRRGSRRGPKGQRRRRPAFAASGVSSAAEARFCTNFLTRLSASMAQFVITTSNFGILQHKARLRGARLFLNPATNG